MEGIGQLLSVVEEIKVEIVIVLVVLYLLRKGLRSLHNRPNIPGPFPWPLIGNAASLGDQPQISMQAMAKKYGPIYLMKLGSADVLVLNDYDSMKEALIKQRSIFAGRPQFKSFAKISQGKGIVFNSSQTQGDDWFKMKMAVVKHLHKFITSRGTREHLSNHVRKECVELVRTIDQMCRQSPTGCVEPETMINVSVANIVCALMFGHRYDYNNKEFQDLISLNRQFGDVVGAGSQVDVMPWIKVFPSFKASIKTFNFLTDRLNNWMKLRTTEHRRKYEYGVIRDVVDTFIEEGVDYPSGLMKDDTIMALTTDVFGAAQDTLSTTVQWIFIYMMYFPECQKKVQQELDSVLGDERLPDLSHRKLFPYTQAVLHEVFRHCTFTSTTIPHTTTQDTVLGGYHVPKDMLIFINQYAANHDPKYWDEPDEFRPERFLDAGGELIRNPHDKYVLFSMGSRKCPGDELSRMLLIHFFITVFALCEVESDPQKPTTLDAVYNLSMRPKSLRTRLVVRKPRLLQDVVSNISEISPHVHTVDPYNSSFQAKSADTNGHLKHKFHPQMPEKPEFSDGDEESVIHLRNFMQRRKLSRSKRSTLGDINGNNIANSSFI